ncbi:hypothetical protein ACTRXD_16905 [Nitrospira sp. T9]|uniref:hypothetical protein n=1 Tax=unclassified Nitrospira TaxID=2652172 RepID=UPI003F9CEF84
MTRKQENEKISVEEIAYGAQLNKAHERIGQTVPQAIEWLLSFAQTDIASLSEGALIDLGYELNVLGDFRLTTSRPEEDIPDFGLSIQDWEGRNRLQKKVLGEPVVDYLLKIFLDDPQRRSPMNRPNLVQVKHLQQSVVEYLTQIVGKEFLYVTLPTPYRVQVLMFPTHNILGTLSLFTRPEDLFIINATLLLVHAAPRIRRCPECQKLFLADRKNKMHCSPRCQNTSAVRRLRQSLPKRHGKPGRPPGTTKAAQRRTS